MIGVQGPDIGSAPASPIRTAGSFLETRRQLFAVCAAPVKAVALL
jgi:hypothetical protein